MSSNLESSKSLAMVGSILLILGVVPYTFGVLGIIGIILLLMAIKGFSTHYQDPAMYQNAFTGIIYYIVAVIAAGIAIGALISGAVSVFLLGFGIIAFVIGLVVAFIFYLLAAQRLRVTFNDLAQKTGEQSFTTAGTLLWYGAILTIIFVGLFLIFIAWIFATIGFFSMRTGQPASQQQPYGYVPPPPPPPSTTQPPPTQATRYCPNCGAPVDPNAAFCPNCGKPLK